MHAAASHFQIFVSTLRENDRARTIVYSRGANQRVPVHSLAFVLTSGGYRNAKQLTDDEGRLRSRRLRVDCARGRRESHLPVASERRRGKMTALDNESCVCQVDSLLGDPHPSGVLVAAKLDVIGTPYV